MSKWCLNVWTESMEIFVESFVQFCGSIETVNGRIFGFAKKIMLPERMIDDGPMDNCRGFNDRVKIAPR